ncbi:MAG TPA: EamA family transporter RarD [Ilumatobacteraceae bacterium]|nr:EamA family transporter RarD [Ilumatobacteraceae bacterium]
MSTGGAGSGPEHHPDHRQGVVAGVAAYLVWGALTLYWRHLHSFDAIELIGWRVICSAVLMAAVLSTTQRWHHLRPLVHDRRLLGTVMLCALFLAANWTTYVWAVVHDHVIETALGYFLSPLGTMALGVAVLHEPLNKVQRLVFVLAVIAVVELTFSYGRIPWLALILATTWVGYGYLKKRVPMTPVETMAAESFIVLLPAIAAVAAFAGRTDGIPRSASTAQLILVMCSGLATIVPLTLFAFAAQRVPLTVIGPLNYIVPTINFCLGWLVFHEELPPSRVIGFTIVWVGLVIATVDAARRSRLRSQTVDPVPV